MALKFGTSGLRGLATELSDYNCYLYTKAFLRYLFDNNLVDNKRAVLAGDNRPSTPRIMNAVACALADNDFEVINSGIVPTPVVSYYGFKLRIPSIMVTGSHIPHDRNGIKFNLIDGEILKKDEEEITNIYNELKNSNNNKELFDSTTDEIIKTCDLRKQEEKVKEDFINRYLDIFPSDCLNGKKVVFYSHSTVSREIMPVILKKLSAEVFEVGYSEKFVPIDTENVRQEDIDLAKKWVEEFKPDAIMSADGDGDRPMLFDERGNFIRGDILGILTASFLQADSVSVTASCNTALEKSNLFINTRRTKIGSPYVIGGMKQAIKEGYKKIVGYEANGGFLTASEINVNGKKLLPFPTRDSVLPLLSIMALSKDKEKTISELTKNLPQRFVYSTSIKGFATEQSKDILAKLQGDERKKIIEKLMLPSTVTDIDFMDGARIFLANKEIVHLRPSGNSPELRSYCEADTIERAKELAETSLKIIKEKF